MDQPPLLPEASPSPKPSTEGEAVPRMSLAARLLNVFAVPSDVFEEVKRSPNSVANWLVPTIVWAIVAALAAVIVLSQPAIQQQIREGQAKALDERVKAGKMTQEQADQASAITEKFMGPTILKLAGSITSVILSFVHVVWWAFLMWLMSRLMLRAPIGFIKALEVAGLAMMINVLGSIVGMLLIVNFGRMGATPSLALAVHDFDATRKSHLFMGAVNVFYLWQAGVMALGLGKLASVSFLRAAWVVFACFIVQETLLILIGLGQFAL
jgi:hypothetical protein